MKFMFDLKGDVTHCKIYFRAPKCVDDTGNLDMEILKEMGFDGFINLDGGIHFCEIFFSRGKNSEPEIEILSTNYKSTIKPFSNVNVNMHRSYSLYDWVKFWLYRLWKKIK